MPATVLSNSYRYQITQIFDSVSGLPVIGKRVIAGADGNASWAELLNEAQILHHLRGVQGCVQLVRLNKPERQLLVEDFGGVALNHSGLLGHVELTQFLLFAQRLSEAIACIHARGVTHKDINPANVLVRPESMQVQVIDFGLATTFSDERPEFEHQSKICGTLAYISPEQTGRMNRSVDYRTDLYALGCTLYHLATGSVPFTDTDPLTLIHAHLARAPQPPHELASWLPVAVSNLIMDLLIKEPDLRYQSAAGVATDFQLFTNFLSSGKPLALVQRKQNDRTISPRPPRRLYGRTTEIAALKNSFARVLEGSTQVLLVKGYSGVGKTSLVHEVHRLATLAQGFFISGKFDQFLSQPFSAPAQSLRQLCQLLLSEPEDTVKNWQQGILSALGTDAAALIDVLPEMQALLGQQAPAPELGPIESQIRLRHLLVSLIGAVASPKHPLILFIDDLQWADQPSLDFIAALLQDTHLNGLMLIGAYRDNEVDPTHPLTIQLRSFEAAGMVVPTLTLGSLALADTTNLVADMLHMPQETIEPLAAVIYTKTGGNPFYTVEFLNTLYRDGVLTLDSPTRLWQWDTAALTASNASDSVVDFLAQRLARLPEQTQQLLLTAACLGNAFEMGMLSVAAAVSPEVLAMLLLPALEQGILVTPSAMRFQQADVELNIRFCHDRMQQVAYSLQTPERRTALHLDIARRLAACPEAPTRNIRAAQHYMQALALLDNAAERATARTLMAAAARQARQAGAFASAEQLLQAAISLLAANPWMSEPTQTFLLHAERHLVLFSLARHAEVDVAFNHLKLHASSPVALVEPACIQVMSLSNRTRYADAVALAAELLQQLGMAMPAHDLLVPAVQQELGLFYAYVADGAFGRLPQSPALTDPQRIAIAKLLSRTVPAAFFGQPLVSLWCILRGARLWVEEGYFTEANYMMACVLLPTVAFGEDYGSGYRAGRLSLDIGKVRGQDAEIARTEHVFALFNCHWFEPLESGIEHAHQAHLSLRRLGDLEFACFTFFTSLAGIFESSASLQEVVTECDAALFFCEKTGNRHAQESFVAFRQLVRALEGHTTLPGGFDDAHFCEQIHAKMVKDNPMAHAFYHAYRALSACLFDDTSALIKHAEAAVVLIRFITGFYPLSLPTSLLKR